MSTARREAASALLAHIRAHFPGTPAAEEVRPFRCLHRFPALGSVTAHVCGRSIVQPVNIG